MIRIGLGWCDPGEEPTWESMSTGNTGRPQTTGWIKEPQQACECGSWFCPDHWLKGDHGCPLCSPYLAVTDPYQEHSEVPPCFEELPAVVQIANAEMDSPRDLQDDGFDVIGACDDSNGCPTEATESAGEMSDEQVGHIVHGKYVDPTGKWPAGMYSKLFDTLEEIEPDMAPGTFHGMFTDKVDVQS